MKAALRIFLSIVFCFSVLAVASAISMSLSERLSESYSWASAPLTQTGILVVSFILILILSKGKISAYGFKTVEIRQLKKPILAAAVASPVVLITLSGLGFILGFLPPASEAGPAAELTFIQSVIFAWLYASFCEEVLFRGLVQSFLAPLSEHGFSIFNFRISVPVLIAALGFGLMHLGLLTVGTDMYMVLMIVISGIILSIIAGYYREASGSLIPAIIVHMIFNVWGSILELLEKVIE
jgi:membrane protease YdiL (CAAX protease family)